MLARPAAQVSGWGRKARLSPKKKTRQGGRWGLLALMQGPRQVLPQVWVLKMGLLNNWLHSVARMRTLFAGTPQTAVPDFEGTEKRETTFSDTEKQATPRHRDPGTERHGPGFSSPLEDTNTGPEPTHGLDTRESRIIPSFFIFYFNPRRPYAGPRFVCCCLSFWATRPECFSKHESYPIQPTDTLISYIYSRSHGPQYHCNSTLISREEHPLPLFI